MKKAVTYLYERFHHLIRYAIIGSFSSSVDFLVYTVLVYVAGVQYIMANNIGVLVGISISFILNRNYNFKTKERTIQRFLLFLTVGLLGMFAADVILYGCVDLLHLGKITSKILSIIMIALFQFLLNKYITFKPAK